MFHSEWQNKNNPFTHPYHTMKNFFLFDWFAFLYRAYYAFPEMRNSEWQNINAVYWFLRMLLKRLNKKPEYIAIARDAQQKTFRHELAPDYKATRKKMDDDFKSQIPIIQDIVKELWIISRIAPWFEADDVIASFVNQYKSDSDLSMYIYSADKDLKQLLTDWVFIVDPVKDLPYQKKDFLAEFWFEPQYIVDYLALLGDNADNIKWVTWIGEKKAQSLIQHYWTIENIYEHLNELEKAESSILGNQKDDAFFSKKMVQLANVDLSGTKLEDFKYYFDWSKYIDIICDHNWIKWLEKPLTEMKKEFEKPQQLGLF